jgi:hypothetical protein
MRLFSVCTLLLLLACTTAATAPEKEEEEPVYKRFDTSACTKYATLYNQTTCAACKIASAPRCSLDDCPTVSQMRALVHTEVTKDCTTCLKYTVQSAYAVAGLIYSDCQACGSRVEAKNAIREKRAAKKGEQNPELLKATEVCSSLCTIEACQKKGNKIQLDEHTVLECRDAVVEACPGFAPTQPLLLA